MKCPKCEGKGFTELEHGLIMVECDQCVKGEIQGKSTGLVAKVGVSAGDHIELVSPGEENTPPKFLIIPEPLPGKTIDETVDIAREIIEARKVTDVPPRSQNQGKYFCSKCGGIHRKTSKLGKRHLKYNDNTSDS